jgi:outer membrane protein assembly factor BamE (lipoprotein component of BamABCDE complex)
MRPNPATSPLDRPRRPLRRAGGVALAVFILGSAVGCQATRDYRGFVAPEGTIEQVQLGMTRPQVEELLGTPSATSTVAGTTYYYISSVFETTAFFEPEEVDRRVYAVEFDDGQAVQRLAHYGLKDGKVFDFISRTTPTRGKELTVVQQIFGNFGRFQGGNDAITDRITGGGGT